MAALTAKGVTPVSNSLEDIITAINSITTDVKHDVYIKINHTKYAECCVYVDNVQVHGSSHDFGVNFGTWSVCTISV